MGKLMLWTVGAAFVVSACDTLIGQQRQKAANDEAQAIIERMVAQRQEEERKQAERQRHDVERREQAAAEAEAAKKRAAAAREAEHEATCASDRVSRVAETKRLLREHLVWLESEMPRLKYFDAHCEIVDSRGIKVTRERVPDGVIIRTREVGDAEDVKCDGAPGRPKGISATWVRDTTERVEMIIAVGASGACVVSDQKALGTSLTVSPTDRPAIDDVLALP